MTADSVQNNYINQLQANKPQKSGFLGYLFKKPIPTQSYTNNNDLLKVAYRMLERAEKDLAEKNKRIETLENVLTIDELTQLTNRRGFYSAFQKELDRTNRGENTGGLLIMIDLDDFKTINDTFGHLAGDKALKTVGEFLQDTIRTMDIAARIGGDEFLVLMPNTSITKAMKRAKRLEAELNALSFEWEGKKIFIHGSIGLKDYASGHTIENIISGADYGMYQSKEDRKQLTRH